jgi:hypothetical protein
MLSQANIDKLVLSGLYSHEVPAPNTGYGNDPRWCKNWTFTVSEYDGEYVMRDTYWNSGDSLHFTLTDETFDEFTFLFDYAKVTKVSTATWYEYNECDRYWAPDDSGGMYCGGSYYIKKEARPSKALKREILLAKLKSAEQDICMIQYDIERLEKDGLGGFYA